MMIASYTTLGVEDCLESRDLTVNSEALVRKEFQQQERAISPYHSD